MKDEFDICAATLRASNSAAPGLARRHGATKIFDYKFEYDFADGSRSQGRLPRDAVGVPVVRYIRVGHFKEPFSLEEGITSDDSFTLPGARLAERLRAISRNTDAMVNAVFLDKRMTCDGGRLPRDNNTGFGFGDARIQRHLGRVTGLPMYEENGSRLLHLGFVYTQSSATERTIASRSGPESHLYPGRRW